MITALAKVIYHNMPFKGLIINLLSRCNVFSRLQAALFYPAAADTVRYASKASGESLAARVLQEFKLLQALHIQQYQIDGYLDVGANVGQNTLAARAYFNGAVPIFAIEPSADCRAALAGICDRFGNIRFFGVGFGDETKPMIFNRSTSSRTSQASTFLEFSEAYKKQAAWARSPIIREEVNVYKMSDWARDQAGNLGHNIFVHLDAEGFDYQVLKGAEPLFPRIAVILVEITFGLFDRQKSFADIFTLLSATHVFQGGPAGAGLGRDGRSMYQDVIFIRKDLVG